MAELTYTVKINGNSLPKISSYKLGPSKLWRDAGRNMSGDLKSVFIGIFPKIFLTFAPTTQEEMRILMALLNQPTFTAQYWWEEDETYVSALYYAGDYEIDLLNTDKKIYKPFSVNLIPWRKKS